MTLEEVDSVAKKKKVEVKKETSLWERRNRELKSLQSSITSLKKSITELEAKIDSQGISGYYSQNHDCMRHTENIWKSCLRLAVLKDLDEKTQS